MRPSVSIVTICYRNPDELDRTLSGLTELPCPPFEVLIIDGSPDDACANVARRFPMFRHMQGADAGKYDAMNKGVAAATGDCVLFINSGDRLNDPSGFSRLVGHHRDILSSTIVYGDCLIVVADECLRVPAPELSEANLRRGMLPSHQSILIPSAYHRQHPYDSSYHFAADTKFLKAAFRALPSRHVPAPIGIYAFGGVSTSPGPWRLLSRQYRELCDAHELRPVERVGVAATLIRRKLAHHLVGEAGLQRLQARRLRRNRARPA
jgi:glycosyltransferase involved in cell wall biosynthesis